MPYARYPPFCFGSQYVNPPVLKPECYFIYIYIHFLSFLHINVSWKKFSMIRVNRFVQLRIQTHRMIYRTPLLRWVARDHRRSRLFCSHWPNCHKALQCKRKFWWHPPELTLAARNIEGYSDDQCYRCPHGFESSSNVHLKCVTFWCFSPAYHYSDGIIGAMTSQITGITIVCSTVSSGAGQRKQQSSTSLAFVRGIHQRPEDSPSKEPITRKNVSIWWRRRVPFWLWAVIALVGMILM